MPFERRPSIAPPVQDTPDEPVVFRTGPHWISQDITVALAGLVFVALIVAGVVDWGLARFAWIPGIPLILRLGVDVPRYWRFETILTTRRLVVNVGIVRDVYHTLLVRHVTSIEVRQSPLGRLLGFGEVHIDLEGISDDGAVHRGTYVLDYVRRPIELRDALESVMRGEAFDLG